VRSIEARSQGIDPMNRDAVLAIIGSHRADMEQFGVASLELFGSVARGTEKPLSDIDLLVEFSRPVSLFDFLRLREYLASLFPGQQIDLVQRTAVHAALAASVLQDAVRAF